MENSGSEIRSIRSGENLEENSVKKSFFNLTSITLSPSALEFFRVALGFSILYDLVQHFADIGLFFTRDGMFPLTVILQKIHSWNHSLYYFCDHPAIVTTLYLFHIGLAFLFMAGRGLPWVTIVLWVFQYSLRSRNFVISDGSDDLVIIFLFISIFLPLKKPTWPNPSKSNFEIGWTSLWSLTLIIQLVCIYFFSALKKSDSSWNHTFTASLIALRLEHLSTSFGIFLLKFPLLLKVATAFFYYLELLGSALFFLLLFFSSRFAIRARKAICLLFIFFHLALAVSMRLGVFPLYCITAWFTLYLSNTQSETVNLNSSEKFNIKEFLLLIPMFIIAVILNWNLVEINSDSAMPKLIRKAGRELSLWQNWSMFAPYPMVNNQNIKFTGINTDSSEKEIFSEDSLKENRHRVKLSMNFNGMDPIYLKSISRYFCNEHPEISQVRIDTQNRITNKDNLEVTVNENRLWLEDCTQSK